MTQQIKNDELEKLRYMYVSEKFKKRYNIIIKQPPIKDNSQRTAPFKESGDLKKVIYSELQFNIEL